MGAGQRGELPKDLARARNQSQAWRERRTGRRAAALLDEISSGRNLSDEVKEPDFEARRGRDDF
jgi:hypothetical protein